MLFLVTNNNFVNLLRKKFDEDNDRGLEEELATIASRASATPKSADITDEDEDDAMSYFQKLAEE